MKTLVEEKGETLCWVFHAIYVIIFMILKKLPITNIKSCMFVYYYNCIVNEKIFIGINSFKMFMAYKDVFMLRDDEVGGCVRWAWL